MPSALPPWSSTCCANDCADTISVLVPGPAGADAVGTDGSDGVSSFTYLSASFVMPASGSNVTVQFADSSGFTPGQAIFIQNAGYFKFISSTASTNGVIQNLGYTGNVAPATVVASANKVSTAGIAGTSGATGYGAISGSPEGVEIGSPGDTRWDSTNKIFYVKHSGVGTNTGWQELIAVSV